MTKKKIFLATINFNNSKTTLNFLKSLKNLNTEDIELHVIIVDNSTKEKLSIPKELSNFTNLIVLDPGENTGFTGGNNRAIKKALEENADYILIINNDVIVDKNLLSELLKRAEMDKSIGIVVPKIYFARGCEFHKERYKENELGRVFWYAGGVIDWENMIVSHRGVDLVDQGQYDKTEETDFATGCCMLVRNEVFREIGLLEDKYFLYFEDADFSQRVKSSSFKIIYEPKAILWHENAGSSSSGSSLQDYFMTRNRLLFGFKYAPSRTKVALFRESFKHLISGRKYQKKGVLDFYLKKFNKGSYL